METTSPTTKLNGEIIGKNSEHAKSDILEEIVTDVISRLRVKPVFQLQCLSKNFSSITYDRSFIDAHLKQSTRLRPSIIVNQNYSFQNQQFNFSMIQCNALNSEITVESLPTPRNIIWSPSCVEEAEVVGSCNGLVVLNLDNKYHCIWNPVTMHCVDLPLPSKDPNMYIPMDSWGFGYCAESGAYKIVKILCSNPNVNSWSFLLGGDFSPDFKYLAEVFTCGKDRAWRSLDLNKLDDRFTCNKDGITVKGVVYWNTRGKENLNKLLTFDLEKEKFARIFCPALKDGKIMEFRGSLALCARSAVNENSFDLWVLKDGDLNNNSWEKIYTIDEIFPRKPIRCLNDHQLLLLNDTETSDGDYEEYSCSLYDLDSEEITEIPEAVVCSVNQVHNFVESMVPLFAQGEGSEYNSCV